MVSCTTVGYKPVVDMKGVDPQQYQRDLCDCQNYARQVSAANQTTAGAIGGSTIGAALGAILSEELTQEADKTYRISRHGEVSRNEDI